jgi:O-antigen/teichoic acid export membrane protein
MSKISMKEIAEVMSEPRTLAIVDQCIVSCGNFVAMLLIGRHLPASDFGLFSLAMLAVLFLSNLHRALVTQPLNVLGASDDNVTLSTRLAVLLHAHLIVVPAAIVFLIGLSVWFFPLPALVLGACCYLSAFFLQETLRRYWYTVGRIDRAAINDLIAYGGQAVLLAVCSTYWTLDGAWSFVIMAVTSLAAALAGLCTVGGVTMPDMGAARVVGAQHWTLSRWLMLTVLALWGSSQMYPFLIASLGPAAIAYFAVCRNLLNAMNVVVQSVINYLPTRAAVLLKTEGEAEFRRHLLTTLIRAGLGSAAFLAVTQVLAYPALHLLYGGTYDAAAPLLRVLSSGVMFSLLGAVLGSYSLAMHDSRSTFLANLGGSVFTFTGGLWLIHTHGIYGAAIAGCMSLAVAAVLQGLFVVRGLNRLQSQAARANSGDPVRSVSCHT